MKRSLVPLLAALSLAACGEDPTTAPTPLRAGAAPRLATTANYLDGQWTVATVFPLQAPGGVASVATAINNHGQITGRYGDATSSGRAFRITAGQDDLVLLGAPVSAGGDINDASEVAGTRSGVGSVRWDASGAEAVLTGGTTASAINERGQAVGGTGYRTSATRALLWERDGSVTMIPRPEFNDYIHAEDINESSVLIINTALEARYDRIAYVWTAASGFRRLACPSPGCNTLGKQTHVFAINDAGMVVGQVSESGDPDQGWAPQFRAAVWPTPDSYAILAGAAVGSVATDVSNDGAIVGVNASRPVIWLNGQMYDLLALSCGGGNSSPLCAPGVTGRADGINDEGQVVGTLTFADGRPSQAVVWTFTPNAPAQAVTRLVLYNADTDAPIAGYDPIPNGATLNLATLPTRNLNVRAITDPATVGSVRFAYDDNPNYRTESVEPYFMAGDEGQWTPTVGSHTITATPYTEAAGGGTAGTPMSVALTVVDQPPGPPTGPAVTALVLYDADTDQPIPGYESLGADVTIDLARLPTRNLNIRAITDPWVTGSVRFGYDANSNFRTENVEPYFMAGDEGQWTPTVGTHMVSTIAYTEAGGGGTPGAAKTVTLRVTDSGTQPPAGPAVVRLELYDADTDQPLAGYESIRHGASVTINMATLPTRNLNVRAVTNPFYVGSVRFAYDGNPNYRTESVEPYYMAGDEGSWTPTVGTHTISATAYSAPSAGGAAGAPLTITLTVTDQPAGAVAAAP